MRIIISDTNALIDLRNATLLEALLRLPYEVQVPNTLVPARCRCRKAGISIQTYYRWRKKVWRSDISFSYLVTGHGSDQHLIRGARKADETL